MARGLQILVGLAACSLICGAAQADNEKGTAVIKGRVVYEGDPPKPKALPAMKADATCHKAHPTTVPDQGTIVYTKDGNAIPYVFVYVKNGLKGKYDAPKEPVTIDQEGCMYHPHVFGMMAGQPLAIKSSDPTAHNIHSLPSKNTPFNISQPNIGVITRSGKDTFTKPEVMIKIKCDVHAWMSSFVGVSSNPFFDVTKSHKGPGGDGTDGDDKSKRGTFEIKNLPAGDYEIEFVHENFGKVMEKVSVKDGETKEITVKMGPNVKKSDAGDKMREVILEKQGEFGAAQK